MDSLDKAIKVIHFMEVMSLLLIGAIGGMAVLLTLLMYWGVSFKKVKNDKYTGI